MDLREKKTRRSIKNAFLQLRAQKPLERITIKELSELAEISKATFYLHYKDIYDLSRQLQQKVIKDIRDSLIRQDIPLFDMVRFARELSEAFCARQSLIDILFSGEQSSVLPVSIEQSLKEYAYQIKPEIRTDVKFNILLSYQVFGGYNAFMRNYKRFGPEGVLEVLDEIASKIRTDNTPLI